MNYIGIDLGGINTAAALVSEEGEILRKRSVPTPRTPAGVADAIAEHVSTLSENGAEIARCIGIGAPGSIDPENGVIEYWSNLRFENVPLADMVRERIGLPAVMENDANCAALGEYAAGAGKGSRSLVVITLGTGIGGGLAGAGEQIMAPIREIADRETYAGSNKLRTRLVRAELGNDAGIIGAALLGKYRPVNP